MNSACPCCRVCSWAWRRCSAACGVTCHSGRANDGLTCGDAVCGEIVTSCVPAIVGLVIRFLVELIHHLIPSWPQWLRLRRNPDDRETPASQFSPSFFHVTHLQPPHLSIIRSVCASSCSPHGMAHMCLMAAPPALLNLSFLPFAVLSLSSFILRCQREQDHHSVGDRPQVQRAEGLAPRSVCSRPQCPVDGVCLRVCACQRRNCLCMCALCQFDLCRWVFMILALREGGADGNKRKQRF